MGESQEVRAPSTTHNNPDLLIWACFVAGGFEKWIDVEELYLKAFQLGPTRLSWRTRPDLPDYKKCAKALQEIEDPKRSHHIGLLLKQGRYTRKLSDTGLAWCTSHQSLLEKLYGTSTVAFQQPSQSAQLISSLESSDAFRSFLTTGSIPVELWVLAEALQCLPNSTYDIWMARLDGIESAASRIARIEILSFTKLVRERVLLEIRK